jgi:hypothetical protein
MSVPLPLSSAPRPARQVPERVQAKLSQVTQLDGQDGVGFYYREIT